MALHEFQIAEVDIEDAAQPTLLVDQLDDHPAFVNVCVIANDTLRSRGVLSYRAHQARRNRTAVPAPPCRPDSFTASLRRKIQEALTGVTA